MFFLGGGGEGGGDPRLFSSLPRAGTVQLLGSAGLLTYIVTTYMYLAKVTLS